MESSVARTAGQNGHRIERTEHVAQQRAGVIRTGGSDDCFRTQKVGRCESCSLGKQLSIIEQPRLGLVSGEQWDPIPSCDATQVVSCGLC